MIAAILATALSALPVLRAEPNAVAHVKRYVRLRLRVTAYGIDGSGSILVDRKTGAFVRHFAVGPASETDGWDGSTAWHADASGLARVQGNADQRGLIATWSHLLTRSDETSRTPVIARTGDGRVTISARWHETPHDALLTISRSGTLEQVRVRANGNDERIGFAGYRRDRGVLAPHEITDASSGGNWRARVVAIETSSTESPLAFTAPHTLPHDFILRGTTTVHLIAALPRPELTIRLNGRPMRFILDTGGQNVIRPEALRRLGIPSAGGASVGGVGAGVIAARYAWVNRVQVGAATLRHQSFVVTSLGGALPHIDGLVGYELLARFAARLDFQNRTLTLANATPDALASLPSRTLPFVFNDRQPEVAGALEGIPTDFTIDTGANNAMTVDTPFVRAHRLVTRVHATACGPIVGGVGGFDRACFARIHTFRLGFRERGSVIALLTTAAKNGASADSSAGVNVGNGILSHFTLTFDYPHRRISFSPTGKPFASPFSEHSGLLLAPAANGARVAVVLTGTPAERVGLQPGTTLVAYDGHPIGANGYSRLQTRLAGPPGTVVRLTTDRGRTYVVRLRKYL